MTSLFRVEAIEHVRRRLDGAVVLASPISVRVLSWLLASVVLAAAIFASFASYARKETVIGWITPNTGFIRIVAGSAGRLERLNVHEGETILAGADLATVRASQDIASGDTGANLVASLSAEAESRATSAQADVQRLRQELDQLHRRRALLREEGGEVARQIGLQQERVRLAQADIARVQSLADRGFFPRAQLEARQGGLLELQQSLGVLQQRRLGLERDSSEILARINEIPLDVTASEANSAATLAQLNQRRVDVQVRSEYVVRSEVSGRVAALPVRQGQAISTGAAIAVIVPAGSHLEAELYVPSRAAGFIREGQGVRLSYQAFPHQRFGVGHGVVTSVSRTVLAPSEVAIPGLSVEEPVFRVQVRLAQASVEAYGESVPLQAGMLLTADVIIDRRSLLEWLLDPIYAVGRR